MSTDRRAEARDLMERALALLDAVGDHAAAACVATALDLATPPDPAPRRPEPVR